MGTWGWLEINDLNGAVDYLLERQDVLPDQIGALGFSLGGQVTIRAAAENASIRAVIAEDPSPAVLADHPVPEGFSWRKLLNLPGIWMVYHLEKAISGLQEPPGILESIGKISPRPLLLAEREQFIYIFELLGNSTYGRHLGIFDEFIPNQVALEETTQLLLVFFRSLDRNPAVTCFRHLPEIFRLAGLIEESVHQVCPSSFSGGYQQQGAR